MKMMNTILENALSVLSTKVIGINPREPLVDGIREGCSLFASYGDQH
jgi:hypothetical protein